VPFNAESFDAATFTNPDTGQADPARIALAFKVIVREYNMRIAQFIAVGDAGYLVLRRMDFAPPAQNTSDVDLVRTEWEAPLAEGDWLLPPVNPDLVGSEIDQPEPTP
jgi:hypothetical protein